MSYNNGFIGFDMNKIYKNRIDIQLTDEQYYADVDFCVDNPLFSERSDIAEDSYTSSDDFEKAIEENTNRLYEEG